MRSANRAPNLSPQRRRKILNLLRNSSAFEAAVEGLAFFKSCSGAVVVAQGDLLPTEVVSLLGDLKSIFRSVTGNNVGRSAIPEVEDIMYRPNFIPRSASSCVIAGAR